MGWTEQEALERLRDPRPISYDDLDLIFAAFDFDDGFDGVTYWYSHRVYKVGFFAARPLHDFSTITEHQRTIACGMIQRVLDLRKMEGAHGSR